MPERVRIYEVGPRDGLQNEAALLPTDKKVELILALADAGLEKVEVTSFVSPRWIPPLADAPELCARLPKREHTTYSALVPNQKGLENLLKTDLRECAIFISASETHNRKNINRGIDEAAELFESVVAAALEAGLRVRAYLSMVWGCPWEGDVPVDRVVELTRRLLGMGCYEVSLGDTVGYGTPAQTLHILRHLFEAGIEPGRLAMHMHDTRGAAMANCLAGLEAGITTFDAAVGGLGGCPYARGASGNLATEDLVYLLHGMGVATGIDLEKLIDAAELAQALVGRPLPGRYFQARLAERRG
ncbi:MAG: hydroxymethylglutaryl-CoA lyase [Deltaproteobacteria bacterium]|nr:hydroxymethylglutaryl-CoA lyase [Deltaproteobacteria bacterium]